MKNDTLSVSKTLRTMKIIAEKNIDILDFHCARKYLIIDYTQLFHTAPLQLTDLLIFITYFDIFNATSKILIIIQFVVVDYFEKNSFCSDFIKESDIIMNS